VRDSNGVLAEPGSRRKLTLLEELMKATDASRSGRSQIVLDALVDVIVLTHHTGVAIDVRFAEL
jgi:hypothetical protein